MKARFTISNTNFRMVPELRPVGLVPSRKEASKLLLKMHSCLDKQRLPWNTRSNKEATPTKTGPDGRTVTDSTRRQAGKLHLSSLLENCVQFNEAVQQHVQSAGTNSQNQVLSTRQTSARCAKSLTCRVTHVDVKAEVRKASSGGDTDYRFSSGTQTQCGPEHERTITSHQSHLWRTATLTKKGSSLFSSNVLRHQAVQFREGQQKT